MTQEKCSFCGGGEMIRGIHVGKTAENGNVGLSYQTAFIVTGTFVPTPLSEANRSVISIDTREQELLYGAFPDYLQLDPSIDLQQRGPDGIQADLSRLAAYGIALEDLRTAIVGANVAGAKGALDGAHQSYTIAANDQISSADAY